ncbi:hypothetical protein Clacol_004623 [Clathrus columnatus]|uniref:Uncharacterized protein n=1 Tax=Clathrus columnatus TaxID=1419009 RepID=A0AAV5A703_9AGAM|nr:hypothetical protein Clacol_004623 [Clathrus columnatus]
MVNKAIDANPSTADLHLVNSGSDWDWAIFALMLFSDLCLIAWTFLARNRGIRLFHYLGILILTTTAIAYYSMASNLGNTPIQVQYLRGRSPGTTRAIWFITTPALLLMLLLATGLNISSILMVIFFDIVMVVVGLLGALTHSAFKWGYYAFGIAALGRAIQARRNNSLPLLVLDLLTKPVFIFALLFSMRNIDYGRFGLTSLKASATAEDAALKVFKMMGSGVGRHNAMASTGPGITTNRNAAPNRTTGATTATNTNAAPNTTGNPTTVNH